MFNRKKKTIESLKQNLKKVNENRLELRAENIAYQKTIQEMSAKLDLIYLYHLPKKKTTNKKVAAKKKEVKKNGK